MAVINGVEMTQQEIETFVRRNYPDAAFVKRECGHVEIEGGNMADPSCILPQSVKGYMKHRSASGICFKCENPKWPEHFGPTHGDVTKPPVAKPGQGAKL